MLQGMQREPPPLFFFFPHHQSLWQQGPAASSPTGSRIRGAEGCLKIAVRAQVSFLLSPITFFFPPKKPDAGNAVLGESVPLGKSYVCGERQKELGQVELILRPTTLSRGLLDSG